MLVDPRAAPSREQALRTRGEDQTTGMSSFGSEYSNTGSRERESHVSQVGCHPSVSIRWLAGLHSFLTWPDGPEHAHGGPSPPYLGEWNGWRMERGKYPRAKKKKKRRPRDRGDSWLVGRWLPRRLTKNGGAGPNGRVNQRRLVVATKSPTTTTTTTTQQHQLVEVQGVADPGSGRKSRSSMVFPPTCSRGGGGQGSLGRGVQGGCPG